MAVMYKVHRNLSTFYVYCYIDKYPGSSYKEIKIWGEEETKTQLEESQCEGLKENRVIQSKLNI